MAGKTIKMNPPNVETEYGTPDAMVKGWVLKFAISVHFMLQNLNDFQLTCLLQITVYKQSRKALVTLPLTL